MTIVQSASPLPLYNKLSLNTSFLQAYFQRSTPFHITLAHYMNSQNLYSTRVYKGYHCDSKERSQSNAFYVPSKCEFESHLHFATISLKSVDIEYRYIFSKEPKFQAFFSNMAIHLVCGKKKTRTHDSLQKVAIPILQSSIRHLKCIHSKLLLVNQ